MKILKLILLLQSRTPVISQRNKVIKSFLVLGTLVSVAIVILSNYQLLQDTSNNTQDFIKHYQTDVKISDENNLKDFEELIISTAGDKLIPFFNGDKMNIAILNLKNSEISRELLNQILIVVVIQPKHQHPIEMVKKLLSIPITKGFYLKDDMGPNNFNEAMIYAAENGHLDIVELMLFEGATSYNSAMEYAAKNGHLNIVNLMLLKGATNYNWAMKEAARGGHLEIMELLQFAMQNR